MTKQTIKLSQLIALIDKKVHQQLALIYQTNEVQELLSTWTELKMLCQQSSQSPLTKVKCLNVNNKEFQKDISNQLDISNSHIYKIIYDNEVGIVGGEPFTCFLPQFYFNISQRPTLLFLEKLAELGNEMLAPILFNVAPQAFSSVNYRELNQYYLSNTDLALWNALRKKPTSRFLAATLPSFILEEDTAKYSNTTIQQGVFQLSIRSNILLAINILNSVSETRWFRLITQEIENEDKKSLTENLFTSAQFKALTPEIIFDHHCEEWFNHNGFVPFAQTKITTASYYKAAQSIYLSQSTSQALLDNILCSCRIAHYIKILIQQKLGAFDKIEDTKRFIKKWLTKYTNSNSNGNTIKHPLKGTSITFKPVSGKPGAYSSEILLTPHMQLESLNSTIRLTSEVFLKK
jgi:type VI secretion system ImpC/EvpB family protein